MKINKNTSIKQSRVNIDPTNILYKLSFQVLQKILRPGKTSNRHVLFSGTLILINKRSLGDKPDL